MTKILQNKEQRIRRHARIRTRVFGTALKPRLSVFKSNKHISAQLIDDEKAITLASAHSKNVSGKSLLEKSVLVGKAIATSAKAKKVERIVFDRGGFAYTGCVKALAEGAREGGLLF
ncbi:MAG: large subunit ribosomal protein [Patescibacteria group bacterium]|nr:large subunit ribosomal protein [Patescibacteria group bacterium]